MAMGEIHYTINYVMGSEISFDRRVAPKTVELYPGKNFEFLPEIDLLSIIDYAVTEAKLADSGVVRIRIETHQISFSFSSAVKQERRQKLAERMMRKAAAMLLQKHGLRLVRAA